MKIVLIATLLVFTGLALNSQASPNSLRQEILKTHNEFRTKHNSPDLQWDEELANYAKRRASQCQFVHTHGPYGENLAAGYPSPAQAITAWYGESKHYSYSDPKFAYNTGHFTQLVWKSTQKVGCSFVTCNGQHGTPGAYLVCEYSPAGNIITQGYFADNVAPPNER